jgi:hypothetical protein
MNNRSLVYCFGCLSSKVTLFLSLSLYCRDVLCQGTVTLSNIGAAGGITNSLTGQRAEAGTTFSVALYFAPDGITDESQFVQLGASTSIIMFRGETGLFDGGIRTAPIQPPGSWAMFLVRAWETSYGTTYETAVGNRLLQNGRLALAGQSGIMRVNTGDPTIPEPDLPASLVGTDSIGVVGVPLRNGFVLSVVPEPSTWTLLAIGGVSLVWAMRRQRSK